MRLVYVLLLSWILPFTAESQPSRPHFDQLTTADGLPENSAFALLQDRLGYVWIGTQSGLVRYDGLKMTTFQYDPKDPHSFKGHFIYTLHEDQKGDIWIGSDQGLAVYERASGRFLDCSPTGKERYVEKDYIFLIHADQKGNIWSIGATQISNTLLLSRYHPASRRWTHYTRESASRHGLSNAAFRPFTLANSLGDPFPKLGFVEDKAGRIWISTEPGMSERNKTSFYLYEPSKDRFLPVSPKAAPGGAGFAQAGVPFADQKGSLWLPTYGHGLYQLDPATRAIRRHYRHSPNSPTGLSSDSVRLVYEDRRGGIWVSTQQGLDHLNPGTRQITHFAHDPLDPATPIASVMDPLAESATGELWFISARGLCFYDPKTRKFVRYPTDIEQPDVFSKGLNVVSFLIDRTNSVWTGSWGQGIFKQRGSTRFGAIPQQPPFPGGLSTKAVNVTYEAPSEPSILWIGTGKGLERYDRKTGRFTRFSPDPDDPATLTPGAVTAIVEDAQQNLWVGTNNGLCLLNRKTGRFTRFLPNPKTGKGLSNKRIRSLALSRTGKLWIGTSAGLNSLDPATNQFTAYFKADTMHAPPLYAFLRRLSRPERQIAAILRPGDGVKAVQLFTLSKATRLAVSSMGTLSESTSFDYGWIENEKGEKVWQQTYAKSRHGGGAFFLRFQADTLTLPAGRYQLRYASDGVDNYGNWTYPAPDEPELWGIQVLTTTPTESDSLARLAKEWVYNGLTSSAITGLMEDSQGRLWVGTSADGLNRLDPGTGKFTHLYDLLNGFISVPVIYEDRQHRLWAGDYLQGLFLIDPVRGVGKRYSTADGLPSNSVVGIVSDVQGQLWLSTFNGLSRFNPATGRFHNFSLKDGLEGVIFRRKSSLSADGHLFFTGVHGITTLDPKDILEDTYPPRVVLTGLSIFSQRAEIGPGLPLSTDVSIAQKIELNHDQNEITLSFVAPHFTRADEITYTYRLDGYERQWIPASPARQARYTALRPGTYTFRVKAANADGVVSEKDTTIQVRIHPPWWQTWWAYSLYAILVAGSMWSFIAYRSRSLRRENRILEEKVSLRTNQLQRKSSELETSLHTLQSTQSQLIQKEKLASLGELTAGIAHEIQNPLNFVNNFSEVSTEQVDELEAELETGNVAEAKAITTDLRDNLQKIHHHGRRADAIVRGMLEHARASPGEKVPTDLSALADEYLRLAYHGLRAKDSAFNCELITDFDPNLGKVEVAPSELGRVLLNLFNNAFYALRQRAVLADQAYTPTIWVSTQRQDGKVEIEVRDNGTGMPPEVAEKIFQPFFTTKPTGEGTGLGLSLSYDIVTKGHGGSLRVESVPGEGTEFLVTLPTKP